MREDLFEIEIGAFAKIQNGYAFKSKEYVEKGLRIIRIANVQSGEIIDRDPKFYPESRLSEFNDYVIEEDDFLISLTGNVGRVGRIDKSLLPALLNQRVGKLNLQTSSIEKSYLYHFLNSRTFVHQVIKSSKGVAQLNTSSKKIEAIKIPISPLPEQRAIVAKIEELFSDLDKGIADLNLAKDQLKVYRQAVLKKAFEGELTKEWREQQTDLPTSDELLEQIKEERQKHYEQQLENWKEALKAWEENGKVGKKPGKPKKLKEAFLLNEIEGNYLINLPESWLRTNLESIALAITDGDHQAPPKSENGIPFITISNVKNNKIDFSNTYFVPDEYYSSLIEYRKPKIGDVLYTVTGSFGIPVLVNFEEQFCFQRHIGLVRPLKLVYSNWLFWLLQTQLIYSQATKKATGTAQKTVGLASLRSFCTSFCSPKEQHQIVQEIESRLSVCDKVEESIKESLEKAKALRQSILKKAFEGTLLSEEEIAACKEAPDYEPASVLLEKIKAEKKKK